jgi:hypothetical protein
LAVDVVRLVARPLRSKFCRPGLFVVVIDYSERRVDVSWSIWRRRSSAVMAPRQALAIVLGAHERVLGSVASSRPTFGRSSSFDDLVQFRDSRVLLRLPSIPRAG